MKGIFQNKIYRVTCIILLISIVLPGCYKQYLTEENPSDVTVDYLYSTADGLRAAVVGLYTMQRAQVNESEGNNFALIMGDCGTDIDFDCGCIPNLGRYRPKDLTTEGAVSSWWKMWYKIIERTNSIIEYGEKTDIDATEKKKILREAYVYRAYAYFWLVRKYDNIWLNLEPTNPSDIEGRTFSAASQQEVYDQVIKDLGTAISYYGDDWSVQQGRLNQGVARLLRADVAMWLKDYQEAADQTDLIITKGPFALEDPENVFTKDRRNATKESMFVLQFDEKVPGGGSGHDMNRQFATSTNTIAGYLPTADAGATGWGRIFPNPYLMSLYDEKYDKRYDIYWRNYYFYNDPNYDYSGLSYQLGDTLKYGQNSNLIGTSFYKKANIGCKKYFDYIKLPTQGGNSFNNIYIFRYPLVLLIATEAYMRLGNQGKALSYINQIRESRLLPDAPGRVLTSINEDVLLDEYARELALEGQRWFLLKRLGKLVERVQLHGGISSFRGIPSPDPDYFAGRTNIKSYHIRWPIPQSQIDAMGGFPQNEGY